jgi:hypothetical protein
MITTPGFKSQHWSDDGKPAGGCTYGVGFAISWQNGPLGRGTERKEPNGAFVEDIISAVIDRMKYYQASPFACVANAATIEHLEKALAVQNARTAEREARNVEGTHAK